VVSPVLLITSNSGWVPLNSQSLLLLVETKPTEPSELPKLNKILVSVAQIVVPSVSHKLISAKLAELVVLPLNCSHFPSAPHRRTDRLTFVIVPATVESVTKSFFIKSCVMAVVPTPLIVKVVPEWESTSKKPLFRSSFAPVINLLLKIKRKL
jgi:hypothetical protein